MHLIIKCSATYVNMKGAENKVCKSIRGFGSFILFYFEIFV